MPLFKTDHLTPKSIQKKRKSNGSQKFLRQNLNLCKLLIISKLVKLHIFCEARYMNKIFHLKCDIILLNLKHLS